MLAPLDFVSRGKRFLAPVLVGLMLSSSAVFAQSPRAVVENENNELFRDLNLPTYTWNIPNTQPKAIVMGFHGACLHGRSYRTLAEKLADKEFMFVSYDMRGFGKWFHDGFGTKKDRAFDHGQSFEDGTAILKRLRETYPGVPVIGMGESFGSFMAMRVAERNPELLDGLILVSNSTQPRIFKIFISPYMLVEGLDLATNPLKRLDLSHYLKKKLSHKPESGMQEAGDPLNRNKQSIAELVRSAYTILSTGKNAGKIPEHMPILSINGEVDTLCNPKAARKIFDKLQSQQKVYVEVPRHGHLLVETPYMEKRVENLITNWLDDMANQKVAARPAQERGAEQDAGVAQGGSAAQTVGASQDTAAPHEAVAPHDTTAPQEAVAPLDTAETTEIQGIKHKASSMPEHERVLAKSTQQTITKMLGVEVAAPHSAAN